MEHKFKKILTIYEYINEIYKWKDCQHCGDEWEYQCYECEKAEREHSEEFNKLLTVEVG